MKELKQRFLLDLQLFSEPGEPTPPTPPAEPEPPVEPTISKAQFDKIASELAAAKKTLKEKMSAEELANQEKQEMLDKLANLEKDSKKSKFEAGLAKQGFAETDIAGISTAFIDGDLDAVVDLLGKSRKASLKALEDEVTKLKLEATQRPNGGAGGDNVLTKDKLKKMSLEEKNGLYAKDPVAYRKLFGN